MADHFEQDFFLPFPYSDDYQNSDEFCNYLTFLPDSSPLDPETLNHWRGTPWVNTKRTPVRPAVARVLHWGSTPDFNFTSFTHPRQPKAKCSVIGSGRPKPESSKPKSLDEAFSDPEIASIKLANAKLIRPKESKFAKLFDLSKSHGETATANSFSESTPSADHSEASTSRRVSFDLGALDAIQSTDEQKAKCTARSRELVNEEATALKDALISTMEALEVTDEETSTPTRMHRVVEHIDRTISTAERIMEVDEVETEEEEQRGRVSRAPVRASWIMAD